MKKKDFVRGFIIRGEKAPCHPNTKTVYKFLKDQGIACQFYSVSGTGHTIPEDFDMILYRAINFVLKEWPFCFHYSDVNPASI